jgi:hypothetical protein
VNRGWFDPRFFFFFKIQGVVQPPPWPKGWPATPLGGSSSSCTLLLSRFFFFFFFFCNRGWLATPLGHWGGSATGLVVAEPPPWPGVASHPLGIGHLHFFFFFNWGWSGHPLRPLGWLGHLHGLGCGQPPLWVDQPPDSSSFFLSFFLSFFFRLKILKLNFQKLIF